MALNRTKCAVLRKFPDGSERFLMAGPENPRMFKTRETAKSYISNMIWTSKRLMPSDFRFIPVSE